MKRGICFCLVLVMTVLSLTWSLGALIVSGVDTASDEHLTFSSEAVDFSCRFDVETSKIHLGGMIRHDVFVMHSEDTVEVYAVRPGQDAEQVVNDPNIAPVAGSKIAIKFEFALDAKDILSKYSRYCVVLRSPDGTHLLASEPKFAELTPTFTVDPNDRSAYKGIATSQVSAASSAGAGRVIIPVSFDQLISKTSSGYVYQAGGENLYFDKPYIEALDVDVRAATAAGAEVYLQYLFDATGSIPDAYDTEVLTTVESVTSFLCERYESFQSGKLCGIIVGRAVDRAMVVQGEHALPLTAYAEKYALYVIAVANAARRLRPDMDIVLPFSSANSYGAEATADSDTPSVLLEAVVSVLERGFSNRFACTTMIESDTVPLTYPDGWDTDDAPLQEIQNDDILHAGNVEQYARYLDGLRERFSSAPMAFMFVWQVPESLSGNALSAAYAYSYFRLIAEKGMSSFVVSFAEREQNGDTYGFSELSHLYTYVDTADSLSVTKPLLSYFDVDSWGDLHCAPYDGSYTLRTLYRTVPSLSLPEDVKGSFSYFDFSTSVNLNTWFFGNACKSIRLNYHTFGGKALKMEMAATEHGYAEAFCLYEYPENLVYTPYIAFRVGIESQGTSNAEQLYEITLTSGTGRTRVVATTALKAGQTDTLVLDLSAYSSEHMSDYWKIGVRPLDGDRSDYSLWIYDIVGYSTEWRSEELSDMIEAERLRIRDLGHSDDDVGSGYERLWMVIGIVAVILMIGVGVFIFLRPNEENPHEERSENDRE